MQLQQIPMKRSLIFLVSIITMSPENWAREIHWLR
jgi:hypothetical protein